MQGHLDEKEEEKLLHAVTDTELKIAYHPNLETLPPLEDVIEKVEFLLDLSPEERERSVSQPRASRELLGWCVCLLSWVAEVQLKSESRRRRR